MMNDLSITVIAGILTVFFLFASSIKILGWQKKIFETQLAFFHKYGLNRSLMAAVGFVELFGVITLWLPGGYRLIGALALFATSAGQFSFTFVLTPGRMVYRRWLHCFYRGLLVL